MCSICNDWKKGSITSKEALEKAGKEMYTSTDKGEYNHLMKLVDKILDKEVEANTSSKEAERIFWEQTHRGTDEE